MSVRVFSTASRRAGLMDILGFYKKSDPAVPAVPVKSTDDVIAEATSPNATQKAVSTKIQVLGRRNPAHFDAEIKAKKLNGFVVHRWVPKDSKYIQQVDGSKADYHETVTALLTSTFDALKLQKDQSLDDLLTRFQLIKQVQINFGVQIPDNQLSQLASFSQIESYLIQVLNPEAQFTNKTEFTPDAIDFNEAEFEGTNISVGEYIFESEKKKMYKKLVSKAKKIEEDKAKEQLQSIAATN